MSGCRFTAGAEVFCNAEVDEYRIEFPRIRLSHEDDVVRLDVEMQETFLMQQGNRVCYRFKKCERLLFRQ